MTTQKAWVGYWGAFFGTGPGNMLLSLSDSSFHRQVSLPDHNLTTNSFLRQDSNTTNCPANISGAAKTF